MKNYLLFFLILSATTLRAQDITKSVNLGKYANDSLPDTRNAVFIGNSITEGWVKANPAFFSSNGYVGRGISGQTSCQLLLRFRQDVLDLHPRVVVINVGTNDIAGNTGNYVPALTMDCIRSMAELAIYNGIKVVLTSVLPVKEYPWRKEIADVPQKVAELNREIRQYAVENGFSYIDYYTALRDEEGGLPAAYGYDGVHPTAEGYRVMENLAKNTLDQLIH